MLALQEPEQQLALELLNEHSACILKACHSTNHWDKEIYGELKTSFSITVQITLPQGDDRQNEGMSTWGRHQSRY